MKRFTLAIGLVAALLNFTAVADQAQVTKVRDIVIYSNALFHCAFPSTVRRPDGELLVAFRRAPDRRNWGEKTWRHTDCNSYLELVRSKDDGLTWSPPALLYANPFGGSQDPCLTQLSDQSILCTTFGWAQLRAISLAKMTNVARSDDFALLGGYILRSHDGGHTWDDPIIPPPPPGQTTVTPFGEPVPAFNRGEMCEGKSGRLFWVIADGSRGKSWPTRTSLMISDDQGATWKFSCPVAEDKKILFNETSICETPKGDLVAFMRTSGIDDHTAVARSTNGGKSFAPWEDAGFQGHPHYLLRLPDQRVLLVYGYRHVPFGIRARVLNAECTDFKSAPEMVLRDDGGSIDLGYPWATMISKTRALVVYYINQNNGTRYIAGTLLDIK